MVTSTNHRCDSADKNLVLFLLPVHNLIPKHQQLGCCCMLNPVHSQAYTFSLTFFRELLNAQVDRNQMSGCQVQSRQSAGMPGCKCSFSSFLAKNFCGAANAQHCR